MAPHQQRSHGFKSRVILGEYRTPSMIIWLMRRFPEMIRTERQGAYALLSLVSIVLLTMTAVLYANDWGGVGRRYLKAYLPMPQNPAGYAYPDQQRQK